ncbi:MAG: hypothetical protein GY707_15445 [Desulfobacteraceae bacterium]|nr:hypothetical protein [Desulfobacteraceae bacterium]
MKINNWLLTLFLFFIAVLIPDIEVGTAGDISNKNFELHHIQELKNGFFEISGGDPYIVFPKIDEPVCTSIGVDLKIIFNSEPFKPVLLELFWRTEFLGFGEHHKVFFTLQPQKGRKEYHFIVPLYQRSNLAQVRLDFPKDLVSQYKIESYRIVQLEDEIKNADIINVFHMPYAIKSKKPDTVVPYFLKALMHGPERLSHDKGFLVFWFFLISVLLLLIRKMSKGCVKADDDCC